MRRVALPLFFSLLAALGLLLSAAWAAENFPASTGRVVDQANILPADTKQALESKLKTLEDQSSIQLYVATVSSLDGEDIATYATDLGRAWKVGEKSRDNGLLLVVAPNEHKVNIAVGYGLEGVMTDALSGVIIRTAIAPRFKSGDMAGGVSAGVDAIIAALTTDKEEWQAKSQEGRQQDLLTQLMPFIILALFLFIVWSMSRAARGRGGRWVSNGGNTIFIPSPGGFSGGGWGGGFSGGGGFDGGFMGGGGGSFGGGGASGSW